MVGTPIVSHHYHLRRPFPAFTGYEAYTACGACFHHSLPMLPHFTQADLSTTAAETGEWGVGGTSTSNGDGWGVDAPVAPSGDTWCAGGGEDSGQGEDDGGVKIDGAKSFKCRT